MIKHLAILIGGLLISSCSYSQALKSNESAPLGELDEGWVKLLQLKNGNTAFLHFDDKKGFTIKAYAPNHKQIADKIIEPSFGRLGMYGSIESVFSIKDDVVILMSTVKKASTFKAHPLLLRIIVNGSTGALVKEEEIGKLSEFGSGGEFSFRKGYMPEPSFFVCKDPDSDNYVVAHFDTFESDRNKRLKLTHYGSDHTIINEGYFLSPNDAFKYVSFVDMVVSGDKKIFVCASLSGSDDESPKFSIGCLEGGSFHQKLFDDMRGEFRLTINKYNNLLVLFNVTWARSEDNSNLMRREKSKNYYLSSIFFVNPTTLTIEFKKELMAPKLSKSYKGPDCEPGSFNGVPQGFYINEDQTYTVVYQEATERSFTSNSGSTSPNAVVTTLGSLGISILNDKFQELSSHLIPACYFLHGPLGILSSQNQNYSRPINLKEDWNTYKQCMYISNKNKKIILYNDIEANIENVKKGKITLIDDVDKTEGFKITMDAGTLKREFVFPKAVKAGSFGMFIASSYDPVTENFVTIKRSYSKGWQNQLVWMKP